MRVNVSARSRLAQASHLVVASLLAAGLSACTLTTPGSASSHAADHTTSAEDSVHDFLREYDSFAQSGYPEELPPQLDSGVQGSAEEALIADSLWWRSRGYHQVGSTRVVSLRVIDSSSTKVTVVAITDSSDVSYETSDGEEIGRGPETRHELRFVLLFESQWSVDQIGPSQE